MQMFAITELVIYIILFKDLAKHNEELKKKNSLGLSMDKLLERRRKNVITLFGQSLSFGIELIGIIIAVYAIRVNGSTNISFPVMRVILSASLVISYFVASPELKRFYLSNWKVPGSIPGRGTSLCFLPLSTLCILAILLGLNKSNWEIFTINTTLKNQPCHTHIKFSNSSNSYHWM